MLSYDLYWSFPSPYSYMVIPRLLALSDEFEVICNVRPVHPLAVRTPEFFDTRDPLWFSYFLVEIHREAKFRGLPFRWPRPDPVLRGPDGRYPAVQPYIHRLTHLGVAAAERGRGLEFLREAGHTVWSGETDGWHEGDHIAQAARRASALDRRAKPS
jgi:2-hydroxychromene-2-carboxylate isomerase